MATDDIYSPQKLMGYHLAVAMIERLARDGGLSEREKSCLLRLMAKRYGFDKQSIFIK